jgi:hypothetical protein
VRVQAGSGECGYDNRADEQDSHETFRIAGKIPFKHVVRPFNM